MRTALLAGLLVACGQPDKAEKVPTWQGDVARIVGERCANCHVDGSVAPFALTTFDEVSSIAGLVASVIETGTMPPWQAADGCNDYNGDMSLSDEERDTLLAWVDGGTPEGKGESTEATAPTVERMELDFTLRMAEPYTPQVSPDDYRCLVIEWPEDEPGYVTGFEVLPDTLAQVHHVLAYSTAPEDAETVYGWDDGEEGAGYTCYGDTSGPDGRIDAQLLGGWAPGSTTASFPEGTGLYVEPGSVVILQMHYNTSTTSPEPDDSAISFSFVPSVEHEAVSTLFTEALWTLGSGMEIPAGQDSVVHQAIIDVPFFLRLASTGFDVEDDETLELHALGLHMHQLGKRGRVSLLKADGSEQCLIDVPRWNFNWQGRFGLAETVMIEPGDKIHLECEWDNSAPDAIDVAWGEGTSDEMCLSGMYLSRL